MTTSEPQAVGLKQNLLILKAAMHWCIESMGTMNDSGFYLGLEREKRQLTNKFI
jgi:hypothetical protein